MKMIRFEILSLVLGHLDDDFWDFLCFFGNETVFPQTQASVAGVYLWSSTSLPGGNQVDGLPPASSAQA